MGEPLPSDAEPFVPRTRHFALPSWTLSLLFHTALLAGLAITTQRVFRGADISDGGISLAVSDADQPNYYDEQEESSNPVEVAVQVPSPGLPMGQGETGAELDVELPGDPTDSLPQAETWLAPQTAGGSLAASATGMTGGPRPGTGLKGGRTSTSVFGAKGEGQRFVYVFDRSGSMGGFDRRPLNAAKRELLASVDGLGDTHQFQIVFYNDKPELFRTDPRQWRLTFANDATKRLAHQFVKSITPTGSTEHMAALTLALSLAPDVIFFLTDADQPALSPSQLRKIHSLNTNGTAINAIEFGMGTQLDSNNFLVQLARENGGQHVYVDLTRLTGP
jgi:hypothetical protein